MIAVIGLGVGLGWLRFQSIPMQLGGFNHLVGLDTPFVGRVLSNPEVQDGWQKFKVGLSDLNGQPARGKVLLSTRTTTNYQYGDELSGQLIMDDVFRLETGYQNFLVKEGVHQLARSYAPPQIVGYQSSVLRWLFSIRNRVSMAIDQSLPEPDSSLMSGLLLGAKSSLGPELKDWLTKSGTTHIVALSGFNITVITGMLLYFARGRWRRWGLLIAGVGVLAFVAMTGASSSVVRAAIMGWVMLLAALWGRKRNPINAVILAAATMVMINPMILQYDVGFQLSLAATLGLIYLTPSWLSLLKFLPAFVKETTATTLAATVATLPLLIWYFGGVSLVSIAANLLIVPVVPVAMLAGFAAAVAVMISQWLQPIGLIAYGLTEWLLWVIKLFGEMPGVFLHITVSKFVIIAYYLALIFISRYAIKRRKA